jgi:hypothetical protein
MEEPKKAMRNGKITIGFVLKTSCIQSRGFEHSAVALGNFILKFKAKG